LAQQEVGGDKDRLVLIVEDDPVVRTMLAGVAEEQGFEILACSSGECAWEAFRLHDPRIIVLDWGLAEGGLDGVELCRKIRSSPTGRYVTILMITGHDRVDDFEQALEAGVTYYMTKPVKRRFFAAWLKAAKKRVQVNLELERYDQEIKRYKEELEFMNEQLEEAVGRANQLTMEAELAYIEVNQIFRTVAGGIFLVDKNFRLIRANESFCEITGASQDPEERGDAKCYELFLNRLCHTPGCPLHRIKKGESRVVEQVERVGLDGKTNHYHLVATPFRGPTGDLIGMVEHITDITDRVEAELALKESERRYRELSIVDELTGLFNKRHFNKHLALEVERARRYGHPLSLLMMDIDNFKHHNDTYGHADGDRVLARLGKIIAEAIRVNDLACRYGGEEFVVILPETEGEAACVVAERIRERFAAEKFHPTPDVTVQKTISIGVAQYRSPETGDALLERADENLYAAKEQGKNRWVFR